MGRCPQAPAFLCSVPALKPPAHRPAGALTGSLYCAGFSPDAVAGILSSVPPIQRLRPCYMPWGGLLTMEGVIEELATLLPARCVGVGACVGRRRRGWPLSPGGQIALPCPTFFLPAPSALLLRC